MPTSLFPAKVDRRQGDQGHSHSGDYAFHSVRGEWGGAGLSREEITCILSLLGDLRAVRHMVRANDRFTAIFAICVAVGRRIRAPLGWPCQRPLFFFLARTHALFPHAVSSSRPQFRSALLLVFSPAFSFAYRRGGIVIRLLFSKVHGMGHGRTRLSFQFSVSSASTLDPGMRVLARCNGLSACALSIRCSLFPWSFQP